MTVDEEPQVRVWIIESTTPSPIVTEDTLRTLVEDELWPSLSGELLPSLALELPSFSVGSLSSIAPALDGFALRVELARPVEVRRHSLVAELAIRGAIE